MTSMVTVCMDSEMGPYQRAMNHARRHPEPMSVVMGTMIRRARWLIKNALVVSFLLSVVPLTKMEQKQGLGAMDETFPYLSLVSNSYEVRVDSDGIAVRVPMDLDGDVLLGVRCMGKAVISFIHVGHVDVDGPDPFWDSVGKNGFRVGSNATRLALPLFLGTSPEVWVVSDDPCFHGCVFKVGTIRSAPIKAQLCAAIEPRPTTELDPNEPIRAFSVEYCGGDTTVIDWTATFMGMMRKLKDRQREIEATQSAYQGEMFLGTRQIMDGLGWWISSDEDAGPTLGVLCSDGGVIVYRHDGAELVFT
jgi:hypothetical protein